jgi:alkylated DNA repair protein (DNA oxidative demethylase)
VKLSSGDVLTFGGPARLMFHGIDRVFGAGSPLIPGGGRINLTLRRVSQPPAGKKTPGRGADRAS